MNITDVVLLIAMTLGPCSLAYLILNDMAITTVDKTKADLCKQFLTSPQVLVVHDLRGVGGHGTPLPAHDHL